MNKSLGTALLAIFMAIAFYFLGYVIDRHETILLIGTYTILFLLYLSLIYNVTWNLKTILLVGIALRLIFIIALPNLSDDYFRFIWDGMIWASGINPFAYLPSHFFDGTISLPSGINTEVYDQLNSPHHYTVYPTIPQAINLISVSIFPNSIFGSVVVMRIIFLIADIGAFYFFVKLIEKRLKPELLASAYFFNPLMIIEIIGNLHHEGIMICFFLGSLYFLRNKKIGLSSIMMALSTAAKLLPLMFLPLILFRIQRKDRLLYLSVFVVSSLILLIPLLDRSFLLGMSDSLSLYYQKLEFNGSIYFLIREVGYWTKGYNIIESSGSFLAAITLVGILLISFWSALKEQELEYGFLFIYLLFALASLILHPWYILLLIPLGLLTGYYFPVLWSYLIFLTYAGYSATGYHETPIIFLAEYMILLVGILFEVKRKATMRSKEISP